jgi:hypothetical protein
MNTQCPALDLHRLDLRLTGAGAAEPRAVEKPFQACFRSMARLWYNHISAAGAVSVTLTNAEKQARYRERHVGVRWREGARRTQSLPSRALKAITMPNTWVPGVLARPICGGPFLEHIMRCSTWL